MSSFSIALTGLQADGQALNTIGNNLANLNTTAFKDQSTTFADLFYQQTGVAGSGDLMQQGLGVRIASTASNFSQGSLESTGTSTDMAIEGNGFFVVENGNVQELTRAGNFQLNANGNLTTISGANVMGYPAVNGLVTASGTLSPITLPVGQTQSAQATSNVTFTGNLNAGAAVGDSFSSGVTMYDSLGESHVANFTFTKTGTNQWSYSITLPAGDATGKPVNNTGTLTFDSAGNLTSPTGTLAGIGFPGMTDGAADLQFSWSLDGTNGLPTLSQTAAASSATATTQDGYASGAYQGFSIAADGTISAQFSNGRTEAVGQIALGNVTNLQGLSRTGDNNYVATSSSGQVSVGAANTGGRGTINENSLEGSNVDISTEFSNLIVAQRAFEANSKTLTTYDTVMQDTINLIH